MNDFVDDVLVKLKEFLDKSDEMLSAIKDENN